jgi:hypothetical protein
MVAARAAADGSVYNDERIPDLDRSIEILRSSDDDPDPPPLAGGMRKPVCPCCGRDDIVRDAAARWDARNQHRSISGTFDDETCERCGAEGDDLAEWVPVGGDDEGASNGLPHTQAH